MRDIKISKISDGRFKAVLENYSNIAVDSSGNSPIEALTNLLSELRLIKFRYEAIDYDHLSYEGKRRLDLTKEYLNELDEVYEIMDSEIN